jgi:hypothetical protein
MVLNGLTIRPPEILGKHLLLRIGGPAGQDILTNRNILLLQGIYPASQIVNEPTIFTDKGNGPTLCMKSLCSVRFLPSYLLRFYETIQNIMNIAMCALLFHYYGTL